MKKYILITILLVVSSTGMTKNFGQNYMKFIRPSEYNGDIQVWDIVTADEGQIFFAAGISFTVWDGTRWQSFYNHDERYFRALYYHKESRRIYAAGNNTFGYWQSDNYGNYQYTELFNTSDSNVTNIFWRITSQGDNLYVQTHERIFVHSISHGTTEPLPTTNYVNYIHQVGTKTYVQLDSRFYHIIGKELRLEPFELSNRVVFISQRSDTLYLFSENNGIYIYQNGKLTQAPNQELNRKLSSARVFCTTETSDGGFIVGTVLEGFYIIDNQLNIINHLDEEKGMESTTVLSIEVDNRNNIWIGLDGGIAQLESDVHQKYYQSGRKRIGSVYAVCRKANEIFMGTNKGLYVATGDDQTPQFIAGTDGQVWDIKLIDDRLIVSHDKGLLEIIDHKVARTIHHSSWFIKPVKGRNNLWYSSDNNGIMVYKSSPSGFEPLSRLENFSAPFTNSHFDKYGALWVNGLYGEVKRLTLDDYHKRVLSEKRYPIQVEQNRWISFTVIDNDVVFFHQNRCYTYDIEKDSIMPNSYYSTLFVTAGKNIQTITQHDNQFFYISGEEAGIIERRGNGFYNLGTIFRHTRGKAIPFAFRSLIQFDTNVIAMGYENGVAFYDSSRPYTVNPLNIKLRQMEYTTKGERHSVDLSQFPKLPILPNSAVNIQFRFTNIIDDGIIYVSLDNSPWECIDVEESVEFAYLKSGKHNLKLRRTSQEKYIEVEFEIAPPFTQTMLFWFMVMATTVGIAVTTYYLYSLRWQKIKRRLMERQSEVIERERMNYENIILSDQVKERDKRLTSFAMNSIRFNNMLEEIQKDVAELKSSDPMLRSQLKTIIRKISNHRRGEENWEIFEKYFNNVYDGFFDRLKAEHSHLTLNDLKIAAYVKLALSTKEIAVLMNISPGSVDTARHRLRRNLGLESKDSLSAFLAAIGPNELHSKK